ncbi:MAG TPA: hypothetical protein VJJ22_03230 [Candidatus Paceibacterota bacterium]
MQDMEHEHIGEGEPSTDLADTVEERRDRLETAERAKLQYVLMARLFGHNQEENPRASSWMIDDKINKVISNLIDDDSKNADTSRQIRALARQNTVSNFLAAAKILFDLIPEEMLEITDYGKYDWPKEEELIFPF